MRAAVMKGPEVDHMKAAADQGELLWRVADDTRQSAVAVRAFVCVETWMSWLDVTEWPALDCQCDGNRNRHVNLLMFLLMLLKLTVPHLVKQLPASHGTGRITTPPSAKWIRSCCVVDTH
jgi:hypothetical protein